MLVAGVVVASVAALWVPQPFDLIARASLWGMLAAVGFRCLEVWSCKETGVLCGSCMDVLRSLFLWG